MNVPARPRAAMLAAVLAASATATYAPPARAAGKEVVMAVASTFTTMDPYDANDTLSLSVHKAFYEGLFRFEGEMKVVPVLSEGHTVTPDGLGYTFKLRKGVQFHDGTDFDAAAVKANLDRVTNPDNRLKRFNLFSNIARTEVVDAHTVRITLKKPFSAFVNVLAHPSAVFISPAALKKYGNKDIAFHPVGTGPFTFVEWRQTDHVKVARNEKYWRAGVPKVDAIVFRPVVDNNTRSAVLRTGEAHFAFPVPYEQAAVLQGVPSLDVVTGPSIIARYVAMNVLRKPFDDLRVRQAINYAINKDALAKVAFAGYAVPSEGVVPPGVEYAVKLGPWPYDPRKARELLKEAGLEKGFETELWSAYNDTTSQKVIQFLQQQLAQVGIRTRVQALEAGQRVERVESVQRPEEAGVRLYYVGWSSSTGEADWALRPLLASESWPPRLFNMAYYKNDAVDAAIQRALGTTDRNEKAAAYREAQEQIWKDAPWAFLVTAKLLYARAKTLSGVSVLPDAAFDFVDAELR
jgi:glutathione transport system substrate-binding protein